MPGEMIFKRNRRALIEQDPHAGTRSDGLNAACRVLQDDFDLPASGAGEPLQKLVHRSASLEIFEQGADRDPRPPENPRAADLLRVALHGRASSPIEHSHRL
jgi:hypothetical protein